MMIIMTRILWEKWASIQIYPHLHPLILFIIISPVASSLGLPSVVVPLGLVPPLEALLPDALLDLLHLLRVPAEGAPELAPGLQGHRDRVPVAGLHLAHAQEHAVLVGAHVEEEPLGVHHDGGALGELPGARAPRPGGQLLVVPAVVVNELREGVPELDEPLGRERDGLAGQHAGVPPSSPGAVAAAGPAVHGLPDPEESPPLVLLQVQVVLAVLPDEELALESPPRPAVRRGRLGDLLRAAGPQLGVVLDEVPEVVAELRGYGEREGQAAFGAAGSDLGDLDEPAFAVLLHVQVEALVLDVEALGRQLLGLLVPLEVLEAAASSPASPAALTPAVAIRHLLLHHSASAPSRSWVHAPFTLPSKGASWLAQPAATSAGLHGYSFPIGYLMLPAKPTCDNLSFAIGQIESFFFYVYLSFFLLLTIPFGGEIFVFMTYWWHYVFFLASAGELCRHTLFFPQII